MDEVAGGGGGGAGGWAEGIDGKGLLGTGGAFEGLLGTLAGDIGGGGGGGAAA